MTTAGAPPQIASVRPEMTSAIAAETGLAEFVDDLTEHMRLQNDVFFPQFERR